VLDAYQKSASFALSRRVYGLLEQKYFYEDGECKMKNNKITIVSSCNDAFAEHVSALFVSVLENTDRSTKLFGLLAILISSSIT
jgi:hypothetical protein